MDGDLAKTKKILIPLYFGMTADFVYLENFRKPSVK